MGLFDKMFGHGAAQAQQAQGADQRFNSLKQKYGTVLNAIQQQQVQLQNLHVQDNKLFIKGVAPSEDAKNAVWDQIKLVDQNYDQELTCEIDVDESKAQQGDGGGDQQQGGETYTVQSGDTLSKISKHFYGDSNEFMRIYYANQGTLSDPDKIRVGQELVIPSGN